METVNQCLLCGSKQALKLFDGHDRLYDNPGEFSVWQCKQCGLYFLNPRPGQNEIQKYYPQDYLAFQHSIAEDQSWVNRIIRRRSLEYRCRLVENQVGKKGTVLDVGCATGNFLDAMRGFGWEVHGIEPSSVAAEYARNHFKLPVLQATITEAAYPDEQFDLITLWDVLEHVEDPRSVLREAKRILKPGGWIVLSLPNAWSLEKKVFGRFWLGWDVPRHYHVFNPKTLDSLFNLAGLELVKVRGGLVNHTSLVLSVQSLTHDWKDRAKRDRLLSIVSSLPAQVVTYPAYKLLNWINRGSFMVAFARKAQENTDHEANL